MMKSKSTFFAEESLVAQYEKAILCGRVDELRLILEKEPQLIHHVKPDSVPVLFRLVQGSFVYSPSFEVLDLLKNEQMNFNLEFRLSNYSGLTVNLSMNLLAWLLLCGGDKLLLDKLIDCGVDKSHTSVREVIDFVQQRKDLRHFNYPTPYHSNPNHRNSLELIELFKEHHAVRLPSWLKRTHF